MVRNFNNYFQMGSNEEKWAIGLGMALASLTGLGLAGVGPMAAMMAGGGGAGAAGAGAAAAGAGATEAGLASTAAGAAGPMAGITGALGSAGTAAGAAETAGAASAAGGAGSGASLGSTLAGLGGDYVAKPGAAALTSGLVAQSMQPKVTTYGQLPQMNQPGDIMSMFPQKRMFQ